MLISKTVYLGLSILVLGKSVMYEFWYDYIKPKDGYHAKFFYMDTDSFSALAPVRTDDIYKDIPEDVKKRSEFSNYEIGRLSSKGKK